MASATPESLPGRVLVVEDEPNLAFNLQINLEAEGHTVVLAASGAAAVAKYASEGPFEVILLDVMLPEMDGFAVARHVRQTDDVTAIIMLTARADDEDRIRGFQVGVDDYILKPFHLQELMLRVKRTVSRSRRLRAQESGVTDGEAVRGAITVGEITLDPHALHLVSPTGDHRLTVLEADILSEFMTHRGEVLSRDYLLRNVWGMAGDIETRTVDNFILRLRRMIEPQPSRPVFLRSVRGRGYRFDVPESLPKDASDDP